MSELNSNLADAAIKHKTRRAVIREEYVAMTGDYVKALIINQFIYWFDKKINFDIELRGSLNGNITNKSTYSLLVTNGWVWKSGQELAEETMLICTPKSNGKVRDPKKDSAARKMMREHISYLVEKGWIEERNNPRSVIDKTKQYRPNLILIKKDLAELGYNLEVPTSELENVSALVRGISKTLSQSDSVPVTLSNTMLPEVTGEELKVTRQLPEVTAIPKTTTDITTTTTSGVGGVLSLSLEEIKNLLNQIGFTAPEINELIETYGQDKSADIAYLTDLRKDQITYPKRFAQALFTKGYDAAPLHRIKDSQNTPKLYSQAEVQDEPEEDKEILEIVNDWIANNPLEYDKLLTEAIDELPAPTYSHLSKKAHSTGEDMLTLFKTGIFYSANSIGKNKVKKHLGL